MNTFTDLQKYKHDIPGRLRSISSIINDMDQDFHTRPDGQELLLAIHEALIKMIVASKEFMNAIKNLRMNLIVLYSTADENLSLMEVDGLKIRYELTPSSINYYFSTQENEGDLDINLGKLKALLPITNIEK